MAAYALLIGIKDGKKSLVIDGSPVEVRKLFKHSDGEGFDQLDVIESGVGRSRSRKFFKKQPNQSQGKVVYIEDVPQLTESQIEDLSEVEFTEVEDAVDIEALKLIASGDKRKAETKEAIAKLEELGVE